MRKIISLSTLLILWINAISIAQTHKTLHAGEIQLALKKLNTFGSALYVAAHPDDENTAMIAWLANDRLVRTGYLSITRGDGGQNLIGAEQSELLGIIRTQELLQARNIDGGQQFFTRANDFGFSKTTEEALKIWDREKVLADVVWTIRKFRPDVIITRFPTTAEAGHGHHSASAVLAIEAFEAAADPKRFPEQLKYVQTWQAKRIVWNAFFRRNGNFSIQAPDSIKTIPVVLSSFNPLLGKLHTVIAAESRSMHKSQGFGSAKNRAERVDIFVNIKGSEAKSDILEDIDLSWTRIKGGDEISKLLKQAEEQYNPLNATNILPLLLQAYQKIETLQKETNKPEYYETAYWLGIKKEELQKIITACAGLWYEATTKEYSAATKDSLKIVFEVGQFHQSNFVINKIELVQNNQSPFFKKENINATLQTGKLIVYNEGIILPDNLPVTQPYWLIENPLRGMYQVQDLQKIGLPENQPIIETVFYFSVNNQEIIFKIPLVYKWTKPDEGELYRSFQINPHLMAKPENNVYMFANEEPEEVKIIIKAGSANVSGEIKLDLPSGWRSEPAIQSLNLKNKYEEGSLTFKVFPSKQAESVQLKVLGRTDKTTDFQELRGLHQIQYGHIPIQTIYPIAEAKMVRLDIVTKGKNIGYVEGAGDDIPKCLTQIGYKVTMLAEADLQGDLSKFDAVLIGVRAFNLEDKRWKFYTDELMNYVQKGGVVVLQYQTGFALTTPNLGPYPFTIGRERVTVEEAPMNILQKDNPILNTPNKITEKDFQGWIQERGLYFASQWDAKYQTVFSCNDPNEKALEGSVLYTQYGEGRFIYTGLSFFREIPEGVPGAYRLLVNMLTK